MTTPITDSDRLLATINQLAEIEDEVKRWGGDTTLEKVKNALCQIHSVMPCDKCGRTVRPSHAVDGMCAVCARSEIERMRKVAGYAEHKADCNIWCVDAMGVKYLAEYAKCTCGLQELLDEVN